MQYHRDGFRPGDPRVQPAAPGVPEGGALLPDRMDVLIVGSGPAGLGMQTRRRGAPDSARVPRRRRYRAAPRPAASRAGQRSGQRADLAVLCDNLSYD